MLRVAASAGTVLILVGCASGVSLPRGSRANPLDVADASVPADAEPGCGASVVEAGEGGLAFRALPPEGGTLQIIEGAQGGIHVLVGIRVHEMDLDVDVAYRFVDPATETPVGILTERHLSPIIFQRVGGAAVHHPDLLILSNESPDPTPFTARPLRLDVEVTSASARACDSRIVTLVPPER